MEPPQVLFVADTDGLFRALRPDTRKEIRDAELMFRQALTSMIEKIRPLLRPELAEVNLQSIVIETPQEFLRGMLSFFQGYSEMLDQAEALQLRLRSASDGSVN